MYYYLKPDEIIKVGDEWQVDSMLPNHWRPCAGSVGHTVQHWEIYNLCERGWRVRRLIKQTKLGNIL